MKKYYYELPKIPNQQFNTNIGENNFEFRFRSFRNLTFIDLYINGELREAGVKALPNTHLFSAEVNRIARGKFRFECATNNYPYYTDFDGVTCRFVYIED
jgi:hypothetical protein